MSKKWASIISSIYLIAGTTNIYANNQSEHYVFHYESGDTYDVSFTDNTVTWKGLKGNDKGKSETDLIKKKNISNAITKRIADIDEMLTAQINAILHNPEFQKLEASWQGLYQLVRFAEPDTELKINVLDATKGDILADAESAADFDDTALFKMVYEHEYGTFGGTPYGLLVSDYSFDKTQEDIETLKAISKVAAAGHTPF